MNSDGKSKLIVYAEHDGKLWAREYTEECVLEYMVGTAPASNQAPAPTPSRHKATRGLLLDGLISDNNVENEKRIADNKIHLDKPNVTKHNAVYQDSDFSRVVNLNLYPIYL